MLMQILLFQLGGVSYVQYQNVYDSNTNEYNVNLVDMSNIYINQATKIENYTRTSSSVASDYDVLDLDKPYCLVYATNSAVNTPSNSGLYGVKHSISLLGNEFIYVPSGVPFSLTLESGKLTYNGTLPSGNANRTFFGCSLLFFDKNGEPLRYDTSIYTDAYYMGNYRLGANSVASNITNGSLIGYNIENSGTVFFNLPQDVYYIGVYREFNNDYYYAYSLVLNLLVSAADVDEYHLGYAKGTEIAEMLETNAFERGRKEGIRTANQYTFTGLLGSVIDAPLQALFGTWDEVNGTRVGGLFNVKILGVDMTAFFTALLSLMIIIAVVRIALKVAIG